jgi:hypothetical protein
MIQNIEQIATESKVEPRVGVDPVQNKKFTELCSLDITSESTNSHYQRLLDTLRLEPFFRVLPATREDNPTLYDNIRAKFQKFIIEGSLTLYTDGSSIHQEKPGQMQFVLAGSVQMRSDRYSKSIPELAFIGYAGPEFDRGQALASWSMAGKVGSHFGELFAVGPVLTLAVSSSQYEELIWLTLKEPSLVKKTREISPNDVAILKDSGIVKSYFENSHNLLVIERERDYKKRRIDSSNPIAELWQKLDLEHNDFLVRKDAAWGVFSHNIHSAIKAATVGQHLLQNNFIYSETDLLDDTNSLGAIIAPSFKENLSNDEMRGLARNVSLVPEHQRQNIQTAGHIFLVVPKTVDVEKPERPIKKYKLDPKQAKIEVTVSSNGNSQLFDIDLPIHGVIDPKEILNAVKTQNNLSDDVSIEAINFRSNESLELYKINIDRYRTELSGSYKYSFDRVLSDMTNLGYVMDDSTRKQLVDLFNDTYGIISSKSSEYTSLSFNIKRELLEVVDGWLARDAMERKGPNSILVDQLKVNEVGLLFSLCVQATSASGLDRGLDGITDLDKLTAKLTLVVQEHFNHQEISKLNDQAIARLNYRDVKFAFGHKADVAIRQLYTTDYKIEEVRTPYDVSWINHEGRDVILVPDRHEDLWGMRHELKALGAISASDEIQIDKLTGKRIVFLGDVLNRNVSVLGLGALTLVDELISKADLYNKNIKNRPSEERVEVNMILGNHELDLISQSDQDLQKNFPDISEFIVAKSARDKVIEMIKAGRIVAAVFLGNSFKPDNNSEHAVATHSMMVPEFKEVMRNELRDHGLATHDLSLVQHLNNTLVKAVENSDFSHVMFAKSILRGGKSEFSGCFETDMGSSERSDFNAAINKIRDMLTEDVETNNARIIEKFGYQVGGHSFNTEEAFVRVLRSKDNLTVVPGCMITDCGDHQNFTPDPTAGIRSVLIRAAPLLDTQGKPISSESNRRSFAYMISPSFGEGPPLLDKEEDVRAVSKNSEHAYLQKLREFFRTEKPLNPLFRREKRRWDN